MGKDLLSAYWCTTIDLDIFLGNSWKYLRSELSGKYFRCNWRLFRVILKGFAFKIKDLMLTYSRNKIIITMSIYSK